MAYRRTTAASRWITLNLVYFVLWGVLLLLRDTGEKILLAYHSRQLEKL